MPAATTSALTGPHRASISEAARSMSAASATSASIHAPARLEATRSAAARSRSTTTVCQPRSCISRHVASPMPLPPPITTAVFAASGIDLARSRRRRVPSLDHEALRNRKGAEMRIGFVGLGLMGLPMARNLLRAGHELAVHSHRADAVEALRKEGAEVLGSPRELASTVDVLCSCRVTPEHSVETFLGRDGAAAAGRGLLCLDFATIDPATARMIASRLADLGIGYLDCPVSGGPDGAKAATLSIMVGGSEADVKRARPLLEVLGRNIFHLGDVGNGLAAKLCNNLITGTLHVLIAEAMVLGTKLGIAPDRLYEVLRASSARSNTLE